MLFFDQGQPGGQVDSHLLVADGHHQRVSLPGESQLTSERCFEATVANHNRNTPPLDREALQGMGCTGENLRDQDQDQDQDQGQDRGGRRGRHARNPLQIPPRGWKEILGRVQDEIKKDRVPILAAGVAFYFMLSLFPFAIAALSLYGLVADPPAVTGLVDQVRVAVPQSVANLMEDQLTSIAQSSTGSLTFGLVGSVLFALWSASRGARALIEATNMAFDQGETRSFLRLRGLAVVFTLVFLAVMIVAIGLIAVLPSLANSLGGARWVLSVLRWPMLAGAGIVGLAALYRFAPDRPDARWEWLTPGSIAGTVLWLVGSALFALYANQFGSFNETYGAMSAVVVLLLWLFLTAFAILVGAEINAESERQTRRDTTRGPAGPSGERERRAAGTVGRKGRSSP